MSTPLHAPRVPHRFVVLALAAGLASPAAAIDRTWITDNGSWHGAANWSPLGVPTPADIVRIGNLPVAHNRTVFAHANIGAASLVLTNGAGYQNEGFFSTISGSTFIGADSRIYLTNAGAGTDLVTSTLTLEGNNARFYVDEATLRVHTATTIGDDAFILFRGGEWRSSGAGTTFVNNGRLTVAPGAAAMTQESTGRYDLDGTTGNGEVHVSGIAPASMAMHGIGLTDPFDGEMSLGLYSRLYMLLDEGWEAAAGSRIEVYPGAAADFEHALLSNPDGTFVLSGEVEVMNFYGRADFNISGTTTITPTASILLDDDAYLWFSGSTLVTGGTIETLNDSLQAGNVSFDGSTQWRGTTTIVGSARQNGPATVSAAAGATINAVTFDMDGLNNTTHWAISSGLVINTENMNALSQPRFDGSMTISGGFAARLTLNLDHPADAWIMHGDMTLGGTSPFASIRLAGTPVVIASDLQVTSGRAMISASATFSGDAAPGLATVTIAQAAAELRLGGPSLVESGTVFQGDGWLGVNGGGVLSLDDGVNLSTVGLRNDGAVEIGNGPAIVSVDRFEQSSGGTLHIGIGGFDPGSTHDLLSITGDTASLAGTLRLSLDAIGADIFVPEVGDAFTILTALGGVVGDFDVVPPTVAGSTLIEWDVLVQPNAVLVAVADVSQIPPCPADLDGSGAVDMNDALLFFNLFSEGSMDADLNYDGLLDFGDILVMVGALSEGCDGI